MSTDWSQNYDKEVKFKVLEMIDGGEKVVARYQFVIDNDQTVDAVDILEFGDGMIKKVECYHDPSVWKAECAQ